tara:strand:+ start:398 stop:640 length:243 start_codon:yes stop_codon:yes gene_type:complete
MFDFCSKINNTCAFATKSTYNPKTNKNDLIESVFCGLASGYDTRADAFPKCWKDMTNSERATYTKKLKQKLLELQIKGIR